MRRAWTLTVALTFGLLVLSSCASSTDASPADTAAPTTAVPTTSAACDQQAITTVIQDFYSANAANQSTGLTLQSVSSVQCAGDWAVAQILVGDGQGHDVKDFEVTHQIDGGWVVADRMVVCGTWNPKRPAQIPADAQIDPQLYAAACAAA